MSSQVSNNPGVKKILPCFCAVFVGTMDFFLIYPFIATLFSDGPYSLLPSGTSTDLRHFYLGLAIFVNPFFKMVGNPFIGELADRFGRRAILCLCLSCLCIGLFITGVGIHFHSLWLFIFGRLFAGFFSAVKPLTIAIISKLFPSNLKFIYISRLIAIAGLSYAISPILGGILSDGKLFSFLTPADAFYGASFLALLVFLWALQLPKVHVIQKNPSKISILTPFTAFARALKHYHVCVFTSSIVLTDLGYSLFVGTFSYAFQKHMGASILETSFLISFLGFGYFIASAFIAPRLVNRVSPVAICFWGCIGTGIMIVLAAIFYNEVSFWTLAPIIGFGNLFYFIAYSILFLVSVEKDSHGWSLGMFTAGSALGFALSGLFINFLDIESPPIVIGISGAICIISGLVVKLFTKKQHLNNDHQAHH